MIRHLRALAWLRFRLLVNGLRGGRRRDALERFSRIARLAAPAALFAALVPVVAALALLGAVGGWAAGAGSIDPAVAVLAARAAVLVFCAFVVFLPAGRAAYGAQAGGTMRLLLLPIPRATLHRLEVLSGLAEPWMAFVAPGIVLFAAGLLAAGRAGAALVALAAAVAILALLASLQSVVSLLASWLLRDRRRSEAFTLVFVLGLSILAFVPTLLTEHSGRRSRSARGGATAAQRLAEFDRSLPAWSRALPSELYGRALDSALGNRPGGASAAIGLLCVEAALCYGLSAAVHRRLLGASESGGAAVRQGLGRTTLHRLPGLGPAVSAVALAQARTALRSVRGRLVVLLTGPMIASIGFMARRLPEEIPAGSVLAVHGHVLLGVGIVFNLYALQGFSMNQFASDRAGLTFQFLAPLTDVELVRGKLVGCAFVLGAAVLLSFAAAALVVPGGSPLVWLAVLLGTLPTYLLVSPLAALLSALLPVASDLSKTGSGGNPHGLAMLGGTLAVLLGAAPAAAIVAVAYHALGRPVWTVLLMVLWTAVAALVAFPLLELAARAVGPRRENLVLVAGGK